MVTTEVEREVVMIGLPPVEGVRVAVTGQMV